MKNKKSLGQHWLKNRQILDQIAALAADPAISLCLEIGPGLGTLTSALLRRFHRVVAVEADPALARNLPASFPGKDLTVIHQDFLQFDLATLPTPYAVAANIPYYITSPIITKLLTSDNLPSIIVLLIQKEVAERIAALPKPAKSSANLTSATTSSTPSNNTVVDPFATPSTSNNAPRHTLLSLQVQNLATVALGPVVPRAEFTPPPQVDSQIIILKPRPAPLIPLETFKLIKLGFSSPRKKLIKNLPASTAELTPIFHSLGLDPSARPANLTLPQWHQLYQSLKP